MDGGMSGAGASELTDAQREATIDALRSAAGDGVIDLEEFGERAGTVYAAERVEQLREVLADISSGDLPVLAPAPTVLPSPPGPSPAPRAQNVVAVMSGAERRGSWRAEGRINAVAVMGGVKLDFRRATLSAGVTHVAAVTIMGGIEIVVPEGVPIEVDGFVLMGGIDDKTCGDAAPGSAMIRVQAGGLWGGVTIRHPRSKRRAPIAQQPERLPAAPVADGSIEGGTATLLFTDVIESTSLAETLGDHRWFEVLREHNTILREQFEEHRGREIKGQGDGFMVAFNSARRALLCAIGIQRALASHRWSQTDASIHVRIGLHTGEVIADDGDLFGRNVIMASRIAALAAPDEILASALTKQLADSGSDLRFGDARSVELRGLSGEWVVHDVEWR